MEALKGLYHADKLDEKSFIENFTIRIKEFQLIVDNLLQQKKKPLQHFLITGKRGMGKSTLLRRIYIEASKPPINEKLFAVRLGAEQYRLSRLFKLWEMVIEHLGNDEPELLKKKEELGKSKQYEENVVHIVNDYLTRNGKTLLLLIDNFDQFIDKIPSKDQHALREALIVYPIQVVGNTVFYNEHFKSYNLPFFDFFKPIHLDNLNREEAREFIKSRAIGEGVENFEEIYKYQKGKIDALRILSGGVPRTLLILLSIVSKKNTGDAVDYLHEMIEQVTPLYQDRMKALSAQQQEIMHNLAMRWDKTPVKELSVEMRIPSKSISAQLVQLEKSGYVRKEDVPGRNHYYEIDERFFNIWLLMSEAAPYDTKRVIWLTKWLDAYYTDNELRGFAKFCQTELKEIKPGNRLLIAQALSESVKLEREYKKQLINEIVGDLKDNISEVKIWVDNYNKRLTEEEFLLKKEIQILIDTQDVDGLMKKLSDWEKVDEVSALNLKAYVYAQKKDIDNARKFSLMAAEKGDVAAMVNLGNLYSAGKNDIVSAEKYYLMAVEKGDRDAMFFLGNLYLDEKKDIDGAERYYLMALEKGNISAMVNLGFLYKNHKGDVINAEKYYEMAAAKGDPIAMVNLGSLFMNEKRDIVGAEKYYLMAVEKGEPSAMVNLGILYKKEKGDVDRAEKYYLMAVDRGDTRAMLNLGNLYKNEKENIVDAEKYYLMAADKGDVRAMLNLGNLYKNEKRNIADAEIYYLKAIEKGDVRAMLNLGNLFKNEKRDIVNAEKYYLMGANKGYARAMTNLGYLYLDIKKDVAGAEKYFMMAIEKGDTDAMAFLGDLYRSEKKNIQVAEKYYRMAVDKGNTLAMVNLGYLYIDVKKDVASAEKYFLMAMEKGDSNAMIALGKLYMKEIKDIEIAEKYFLMAIKGGSINAMVFLGDLYRNEKKDIVSAERYYLMAADKDNVNAMFNLGFLYKTDKKDLLNAERYYLMAVERGDTDAMVNLGVLYQDEKKDAIAAEKYYLMAVEKGEPGAMGNLANFYFEVNNTGQKERALELSNKAVEMSNYLNVILLNIHIGILLWNGKIKDAGRLMTELLNGSLHTDNNIKYISEAMQYFLVFKQKYFLHKLFSANMEWIDRYKPIYYALLSEMKEEYLKEYLKMTSELKEPVTSIQDFIVKERERLGI